MGSSVARASAKSGSQSVRAVARDANQLVYEQIRSAAKSSERSLVDQLFIAFEAYNKHCRQQPHTLSFRISTAPYNIYIASESIPAELDSFGDFCGCVALRFLDQQLFHLASIDTMVASGELRARLSARLREVEIDKWKDQLAGLQSSSRAEAEVELRLLVSHRSIRLEWQTVGDTRFKPVRQSDWRRFREDPKDSGIHFTVPAHYMWALYEKLSGAWFQPALAILHETQRRTLNHIFRDPRLRPWLANSAGSPFDWHDEPLVWRTERHDQPASYEVALFTSMGIPVKGAVLVLPGSPYFYVTATAVHPGPPPFVPDAAELRHLIPAEAMETQAGVDALQRAGADLPEQLRVRIQRLSAKVTITCQLRKNRYVDSEIFELHVVSATPGGELVEEYRAGGWKVIGGNIKATEDLLLFDRSAQASVPRVLDHLRVTPEPGNVGKWTRRITRAFAEEFVAWAGEMPNDLTLVATGELASLLQPAVKASVEFDLEAKSIDWFDLRVRLNAPNLDFTPEELELLLKARGRHVRLKGKGWQRLDFALDEEKAARMSRLGLDPLDFSGEPQRLHVLQLADAAGEKEFTRDTWLDIRERASAIKARVTPDQPAEVNADLRPYQREGFHFLAYLAENHFGGILADDMGLGKTLQTLTWLAWLVGQDEKRKPSLVVCPKSVMDVWVKEAEKFTPGLRLTRFGLSETGSTQDLLKDVDLLVVNYAQLRILSKELLAIPWRAVILDEGQNIKNPASQTARTARDLTADHRLVLTGTPIENRLMDLWSLMAFAMPGILGTRAYFSKRFDQGEDTFTRVRLSARLRPFLLRRTKEQVAPELPRRTEEDVHCEMEGTQLSLYSAELKRAQAMLLRVKTTQALNKERFNILQTLIRLRQICCHPALIDPSLAKTESAKMSAMFDLLGPMREENSKVLIFSQFVTMLDILRQEFRHRKWDHLYLTGQTEDRGELVQKFQEAKGPLIFLLSLRAAGAGLNLTSAPYVILFDPWWNPAVEAQAIDRTHRIGQTQNVFAYRLVVKQTIEEKIRQLQEKKKLLVESVLADEGFSKALSLDDLNFLLSD